MKKDLTEVVFILDRSGSMAHLAEDSVGGFNSMIKEQQQVEGECLLTTVLFNHESTVLYDRVPMASVRKMTTEDFHAHGMTALLDAVGSTIERIHLIQTHQREEDKPAKTIFFITTDGMENSSKTYSAEKVRDLIGKMREVENWEFVFLASDLSLLDQGKDMDIICCEECADTAESYHRMSEACATFRMKLDD